MTVLEAASNVAVIILGIVAAILTAVSPFLVPLARELIQEWLLASRNRRLTMAAETVAADLIDGKVGEFSDAVTELRTRQAETIEKAGGVADEVLAGLVAKGVKKLTVGAAA